LFTRFLVQIQLPLAKVKLLLVQLPEQFILHLQITFPIYFFLIFNLHFILFHHIFFLLFLQILFNQFVYFVNSRLRIWLAIFAGLSETFWTHGYREKLIVLFELIGWKLVKFVMNLDVSILIPINSLTLFYLMWTLFPCFGRFTQ